MLGYFVMRTSRKMQDVMTARPVYSGESEKDSLRSCHTGLALRQTDRTTTTRPILVLVSFPFSILLLPFSLLERGHFLYTSNKKVRWPHCMWQLFLCDLPWAAGRKAEDPLSQFICGLSLWYILTENQQRAKVSNNTSVTTGSTTSSSSSRALCVPASVLRINFLDLFPLLPWLW